MLTPEQLYQATDDGLRIIALHYPEATEAARTNKAFKARADERTPSARVKLFPPTATRNFSVWKLTDFGGEGQAEDPINIHMRETGYRFNEAILDLAAIFNIQAGQLNKTINKPDIRKEPATAEQLDGQCFWQFAEGFTEAQLKVMGPRVKAEHMSGLHWYAVKSISHVRNREVITKYSNENYPIFMRECWFSTENGDDKFYKIYEPLNPDKQWRFSYQPMNKKPKSYINGLNELKSAYRKYNDAAEKKFNEDPANENKQYRAEKLPEAIICSGERDAICVKSLGYFPLWFNSETYKVSYDEYWEIMKYVEKLYNIPDIDVTGKIKGSELALKFIDIHTIWLPSWLSSRRDNRGKPRKDFRDWMELRDQNKDFSDLMTLATPARFWTTYTNKEGKKKLTIDVSCLHEFLTLNGFYTFREDERAPTQLIRINGNIVTETTPKEIRNFVYNWCVDTAQTRDLRNLVLTTPLLKGDALEALKEVNLDFTNYTSTSQFFYFPNFTAEVTPTEIIKHDVRNPSEGHYVWDKNVIDHRINILGDMFNITHTGEGTKSEDYDIQINAHGSNFFRYLINASRIYWREELEYAFIDRPEEAAAYQANHRFDIAGEGLTPAQIQEQKQCLISKIFTIGYLMHRFKSPSRAWASYAMDNKIGENGQCNGRSGKSFLYVTLSHFLKYVKISGRNPKIMENNFVFEQITRFTDLVLVDDCDEYLPIKAFYDSISSDMTVNRKNVSMCSIPFEEAPKFAFTTNYVPKEFDPSSRQRMLYMVFSDYYHERTEENDYLETRQIRDDFNKDLFVKTYSEAEWEADINFILQCVKFYLSISHLPIKIEPNMQNIIYRKFKSDMSENFREWAEYYFSPEAGHLNTLIIREDALSAYKYFSGVSKITMQKFTKSLKGFCYTCDYVDCMNPEDLCNSGNRIIKRIEDPVTHAMVSKEMIYIRTKAEAEQLHKPIRQAPEQLECPF
jgi:hypothetical protein